MMQMNKRQHQHHKTTSASQDNIFPELLVPPDNILLTAAGLPLQLAHTSQVLAAWTSCNANNQWTIDNGETKIKFMTFQLR